jgi:hypothetical protein
VILGTEELTLFTVVLPRAWESSFGDFLSDLEIRVARLLEDARFPGSLKLTAFTITKLTDQRFIQFGDHLATAVRGINGLADALCSSEGLRRIEEQINSHPLELLDHLTPGQALLRQCQCLGEPVSAGNAG